jgi:phosphoribosylamine-glycine ligase
MHAVAVRVTLHDVEEAQKFLREELVRQVSKAPGFVAGYWVRVAENRRASVVAFESEETARAAAERVATRPPEAATIDSVEVGEVVAHA